jgi:integral membrane protein
MKENMQETPIRPLRVVGLLEGASFLILLGIAMPLKHIYGYPLAVRFVGSLHGMLFLMYLFFLAQVRSQLKWPLAKVMTAFVAALLPFGTFVLDRRLREEEKLLQTSAERDNLEKVS